MKRIWFPPWIFCPPCWTSSARSIPKRLDGRSFLPLLHGKKQSGREHIIKEYNENAGASRDPMRAIQTKRYLYLFNPWSNGKRIFATATTGTATYRRMAALASSDKKLAARLDLYKHRVPEELYDVANDPDCLVHNLIANLQTPSRPPRAARRTGSMDETHRRPHARGFPKTRQRKLPRSLRAESGKGSPRTPEKNAAATTNDPKRTPTPPPINSPTIRARSENDQVRINFV